MAKYVIEKGFISRGTHISYEADLEFDTLEEARKEFEFLKTQPLEANEYLSLFQEDEELDYFRKDGN